MSIKNVSVIGTGIMGTQIAMQVAICGYEVNCYDISESNLKKADSFSKEWFNKKVSKGKMSLTESEQAQGRLTFTTDVKLAAENADLVIEAVADIVEIKKKALQEVDKYAKEKVIYASNSSYLVSSKFNDAVRKPENVLNVHFFNPALVMELVEVVKAPHVKQETIDVIFDFIKSINKTPVLVNKEIYGFIVNRIFSAITKEACYLVDQGVASIEDIDTAVKKGLGHPMGPLELLDMTGIDLEYNVLMEKYRMTGDLSDKPSPALVERYAKGQY